MRELENAIERAVLISGSGPLDVQHFIFDPSPPPVASHPERTGSIWEMERALILNTLERHGGNRTHAAKELGISIRTMRNKLRDYRELHEGLKVS